MKADALQAFRQTFLIAPRPLTAAGIPARYANRAREPGGANRLPRAEVDPFSRKTQVVQARSPASRARGFYRTDVF